MSGDANFSIQRTGMTLGGFIQPSVARALIEQQSNVEKGLCQRFLWIVPKPTIVTFDQLQQVDTGFIAAIGEFQINCNFVSHLHYLIIATGVNHTCVHLFTSLSQFVLLKVQPD